MLESEAVNAVALRRKSFFVTVAGWKIDVVIGDVRFSRHLMNVLLPAPFGPSSPMVPAGTRTLTSISAFCVP